jgi:polar amino acid transport system substrate-binding protein
VGVLLFPRLVAQAALRRSDFQRTGLKLYDSSLYLGFSKDVPARVIDAWSAALADLKASGRYAEIVEAYRLTE